MSQEDDDKKKKNWLQKLKNKDTSDALSKAAKLASSIANASGAKKYRDAGVDKGTPVEANEQMPKGMNVTVTDAYSTPRTGDDMGQMDPEKRKKKYGF